MGSCVTKPKLRGAVRSNPKYDDTIEFVPPFDRGYVIKVYDGDTITLASQLPGTTEPIYRVHVRLSGIDAPEIKSDNDTEKALAHKARCALSDLIFGKVVILKNTGNEKYGRLLANVYLDNLHVNQWMLDNRYAVPYDGGTKLVDWKNYHETGFF